MMFSIVPDNGWLSFSRNDYSSSHLKALGRYSIISLAMRLSLPVSRTARSPASPCRYTPRMQACSSG